ncbi:phosphoesterase, PA-phosphatase related protein [Roseobacter sp. SK209-2-6]|nr:phosphoesterase, PA-phosphatase related protein [Roseobacter sp. SK209-2-6]
MLLSAALDATAKSLNAAWQAKTSDDLEWIAATPDHVLDFERLNSRHRMSLIQSALTADITVAAKNTKVLVSASGSEIASIELHRDVSDPAVAQFWNGQLAKVHNRKWHRDERLSEIVLQQTDILSFMTLPTNLGPTTHPYTLLYLQAVLKAVFKVTSEVKRHFQLVRPADLAPEINPVIQTPAHSAYPSGHATESFSLAVVLETLLFDGASTELKSIAARITDNRAIAGVHYPADGLAGATLGLALASTLLSRTFDKAGGTGSTIEPIFAELHHSLDADAVTAGPQSDGTVQVTLCPNSEIEDLTGDLLRFPHPGNLKPNTGEGLPQQALAWLAGKVLKECGLG